MEILILCVILIYLIPCHIVGYIARDKQIGYRNAFIISMLFTPIFGILCVIASVPKKYEEENNNSNNLDKENNAFIDQFLKY